MAYEQIYRIALKITRMALLGFLCHSLFTAFGIWAILIVLSISLIVGFFYFLAMCIAAGLENKYGEFDRYMWRKPKQLPQVQKLLPCK
jgi:hypothetical protein